MSFDIDIGGLDAMGPNAFLDGEVVSISPSSSSSSSSDGHDDDGAAANKATTASTNKQGRQQTGTS